MFNLKATPENYYHERKECQAIVGQIFSDHLVVLTGIYGHLLGLHMRAPSGRDLRYTLGQDLTCILSALARSRGLRDRESGRQRHYA